MPLGSRHEETGRIFTEGADLILQRDDGGRWRLDGPRRLAARLGERATLGGSRTGFDLLEVDTIDGTPAYRPFIASWEFAAGVLSTLVILGSLMVAISRW